MHWTSWYHCLKDTSVFPGVASPLKVLILGVPILSLAVSMLGRQLTSTSAQGGLVGHYVGLLGPHLLTPLRSTSLSSMSVSFLPPGTLRLPRGDLCWGCFPSLIAISIWRTCSAPLVDHHWGPRHPWLVPAGAHWLGWAHWGEVGYPPPTLDRHPSIRGVTAPCSNVAPYLHTRWGQIQSWMGALCQTVATARWHVVAIILESDGNTRTVSVSGSCSTPSECSWPNPTHSSTLSSSLRMWDTMGCHCLRWQPIHQFSSQSQYCHSDLGPFPLRWSPWMQWTC